MSELNFDLIIIGGGPAGLSSAIYASREGLKVAVLDKSIVGGQPLNYLEIENYPGYIGSSAKLSETLEEQAKSHGATLYLFQDIQEVVLTGDSKKVITSENSFTAPTIIISTGAHPRTLNIPGEKENIGTGVSFCAVCDGAFYKDKVVAVIGGGNSALEEACYLTKFATSVFLIHRRNKLRADKVVQDRAFSNKKISFLWNTKVERIISTNNRVSAISISTDGYTGTLNVQGVFPYIGHSPNTSFISDKEILDENNFIITDNCMRTSIPGVFATGDVRATSVRQVITATSDGAVAAIYASKYLDLRK